MNRTEKRNLVEELKGLFTDNALVVVTQQSGLTVAESTEMRVSMREAGAFFKVTKNTLARIAAKDSPAACLEDLFTGPTGVAVSQDPVAAAKVAAKIANDNDNFKIVGASLNGQVLTEQQVVALSKLPSLDELRGKIVGLLQAPAQKLASVTQAPAGQLARVFGAYGAKDS